MMPSLKGFGSHFNILPFSGINMVGLFEVLIILTVTVYRVAMHEEERLRKGPWLEEEDELLTTVVSLMGERRWDSLAKASGLRRSGKSCRMRWLNYLHPNLKRGRITAEEEQTIFLLHERWGNKWSKIAQKLPGRTDNEIKNYWRCHMKKKGEQTFEELKEQGFSANCSSSGTTIEISNYSFSTSSPYETQLSDWISSWTNEQSFTNNDGVFSDKCEGVSDEGSLWGCNSSGCLWVWDAN